MKNFFPIFLIAFFLILFLGFMCGAILWTLNNLNMIPAAILASFLVALAVAVPIAIGISFIGD